MTRSEPWRRVIRASATSAAVGLAIGVELTDADTARSIKEGLRERGVLIGTCGRDGNVLKIRPPLAFTTVEVPVFTAALEATLASAPST